MTDRDGQRQQWSPRQILDLVRILTNVFGYRTFERMENGMEGNKRDWVAIGIPAAVSALAIVSVIVGTILNGNRIGNVETSVSEVKTEISGMNAHLGMITGYLFSDVVKDLKSIKEEPTKSK